jgi:hypothetical protein
VLRGPYLTKWYCEIAAPAVSAGAAEGKQEGRGRRCGRGLVCSWPRSPSDVDRRWFRLPESRQRCRPSFFIHEDSDALLSVGPEPDPVPFAYGVRTYVEEVGTAVPGGVVTTVPTEPGVEGTTTVVAGCGAGS